MKNRKLFIVLLICSFSAYNLFSQVDSLKLKIEKIEKSFNYKTGVIEFPSCSAKMTVPQGFKYLNSKQGDFVLSKLWGNPSDTTILGLLVPENKSVFSPDCWVFTITFDKIGYVKDNDAEDIDYDNLLQEMQKEASAGNIERAKLGYPSVEIVGWASKPYYDKSKKVLHWAKEAKFGTDSINTLNYNLRILGKEGVFELTAVASISELNEVKPTIDKVLASVEFEKGSTYFDFNPEVDKVAAWTIGGLVAGKVLAKVGFFAVILKFGKVIFLALAAFGAGIWKFITGRKKKEEEQTRAIE